MPLPIRSDKTLEELRDDTHAVIQDYMASNFSLADLRLMSTWIREKYRGHPAISEGQAVDAPLNRELVSFFHDEILIAIGRMSGRVRHER